MLRCLFYLENDASDGWKSRCHWCLTATFIPAIYRIQMFFFLHKSMTHDANKDSEFIGIENFPFISILFHYEDLPAAQTVLFHRVLDNLDSKENWGLSNVYTKGEKTLVSLLSQLKCWFISSSKWLIRWTWTKAESNTLPQGQITALSLISPNESGTFLGCNACACSIGTEEKRQKHTLSHTHTHAQKHASHQKLSHRFLRATCPHQSRRR